MYKRSTPTEAISFKYLIFRTMMLARRQLEKSRYDRLVLSARRKFFWQSPCFAAPKQAFAFATPVLQWKVCRGLMLERKPSCRCRPRTACSTIQKFQRNRNTLWRGMLHKHCCRHIFKVIRWWIFYAGTKAFAAKNQNAALILIWDAHSTRQNKNQGGIGWIKLSPIF